MLGLHLVFWSAGAKSLTFFLLESEVFSGRLSGKAQTRLHKKFRMEMKRFLAYSKKC
jgi:hypothetical protein